MPICSLLNSSLMPSLTVVKFQNFDLLKVPYFCWINSGPFWKFVGLVRDFSKRSLWLSFFWPITFYVHEKLQRNPFIRISRTIFIIYHMDLKIWDFWQTPTGVLWAQKLNGSVIYRDLDWWPSFKFSTFFFFR